MDHPRLTATASGEQTVMCACYSNALCSLPSNIERQLLVLTPSFLYLAQLQLLMPDYWRYPSSFICPLSRPVVATTAVAQPIVAIRWQIGFYRRRIYGVRATESLSG